MPFFVRYIDGDLLLFVHNGSGPTVDPNERTPGQCYLGDPQVVNMSPVGLARFCTLRSCVKAGPESAVPALVIGNLADDACTPSHTRRLYDAIGHPDKEMHEIPGADRYYSGPDQRNKLRQAVGVCTDWLHRHGFGGQERSDWGLVQSL
jgi:hypothetical protein